MPHKVENKVNQIVSPKIQSLTENNSKVRISIEPYPFASVLPISPVDSDDSGDTAIL